MYEVRRDVPGFAARDHQLAKAAIEWAAYGWVPREYFERFENQRRRLRGPLRVLLKPELGEAFQIRQRSGTERYFAHGAPRGLFALPPLAFLAMYCLTCARAYTGSPPSTCLRDASESAIKASSCLARSTPSSTASTMNLWADTPREFARAAICFFVSAGSFSVVAVISSIRKVVPGARRIKRGQRGSQWASRGVSGSRRKERALTQERLTQSARSEGWESKAVSWAELNGFCSHRSGSTSRVSKHSSATS